MLRTIPLVLVALLCLAACGDDPAEPGAPGPGGPGVAGTTFRGPPAATVVKVGTFDVASGGDFATDAFPPTLPDQMWHRDIWTPEECLECHKTGEEDAPIVQHEGLPPRLMKAACRTCHVLIPGQKPRGDK